MTSVLSTSRRRPGSRLPSHATGRVVLVFLLLSALTLHDVPPAAARATTSDAAGRQGDPCPPTNLVTPPNWDPDDWSSWITDLCLPEGALHDPDDLPTVLFRADGRDSAVIEAEGFRPRPWPEGWTRHDDDILRHILEPDHMKAEGSNADGFVSFTNEWGAALLFDDPIYEVDASSRFVSVPNSWQKAVRTTPELFDYKAAAVRHDVPETTVRDRYYKALSAVESESEWVALDGVPPEHIRGKAAEKRDAFGERTYDPSGEGDPDVAGSARKENPSYREGAATGTPNAQGIAPTNTTDSLVCRRLTPLPLAGPRPDQADACGRDLDDITEHDVEAEGRFSGDVDDTDWDLDLQSWADGDSVLAPLPNTVDDVTHLDWHGIDEEGMAEHADGLVDSIGKDLEALARTTSEDSLVDRVASALGKGIDVGSELLPYAGLAATGYALRTDLDDGKWGDAAADGILEGLQLIEVVAPEFDVFTEPAILIVAAIQMIGDEIFDWLHPHPTPPDWNVQEMDEALRAADTAPGELWRVWRDERRSSYLEGIRTAVDGTSGYSEGSVRTRLEMDMTVLADLHLEIVQHLSRVQRAAERKGVPHATARRIFEETMTEVRRRFVTQAENRQGAYIIAAENAVGAAMASPVPASTFTALDAKFSSDAVHPLLTGVSSNVWAVFYDTAPADWDRTLDPGDLTRVRAGVEEYARTTSSDLLERNSAVGPETFSYERADVDVTRDRLSSLLLPLWKTFFALIGSGRTTGVDGATPAG